MSPAEKRYFKRHYGSESNVLTDIFDAINAQNIYDESSIKQSLSAKAAANFKVYKFQLQQQVLQSLISSGYFSTVGNKIRLGLEQADILAERNLIDMAIKQLEKTRQLCYKYEEFPYLLEITAKKFRLKYAQTNLNTNIPEPSFEEHRRILETLLELNQLTDLARQVGKLAKKWPDIDLKNQRLAREYRDHPLLQKKYPEAPIRSNFTILQILGNITLVLGDTQQAKTYFKESVELFAKDKKLKQHFAFYYLLGLRRSITLAIHMREIACASEQLNQLNQFLGNDQQYQSYQVFVVKSELQMAILTGGSYRTLPKLEQRASDLIRNYNLPEDIDLAKLYFLLASFCTVMHRYNEALDYLQMLSALDRNSRSHFCEVVNILEWVIFYEQDDLPKAKRKLGKMRQQYERDHPREHSILFSDILHLFQCLLTDKHKAPGQAKELLKKIEDTPGDQLAQQFHAICFQAWLQGVIEAKAYRTVLAKAQ